MVEKICNALIDGLTKKLTEHHLIYRLPCTSEYLEELISDSLNEAGLKNDWQPNRSHTASVDMKIKDSSISVKSGVYDLEKASLKFSGSRLGKHETIDQMISHLNDTSADYYVCVAKRDQDWSPTPAKNEIKVYYLFVFDAKHLNYDSSLWNKVTTRNGGYNYEMESIGMKAKISTSLSSQLWTTLDESISGKPRKLVINVLD